MSRRDDRRPPRARRGFTLVEGAAALVVIGLAAASALASFGADLRATGRVRHAAVAEAVAQQRLATLRLLPRAELLRLPDSLRRGELAPPLAGYHWRASSTPVRLQDDLFQLRVDVGWPGGAYTLVGRQYRPRPLGSRR